MSPQASPGSQGLFHAAISLSGSPNITLGLSEAETQGVDLVTAAGCDVVADRNGDGTVLDCMYALSAAKVAAATPASWNFAGGPSIPAEGANPSTVPRPPGLPIIDGVRDKSCVSHPILA
jgi:carboxylesterase type B